MYRQAKRMEMNNEPIDLDQIAREINSLRESSNPLRNDIYDSNLELFFLSKQPCRDEGINSLLNSLENHPDELDKIYEEIVKYLRTNYFSGNPSRDEEIFIFFMVFLIKGTCKRSTVQRIWDTFYNKFDHLKNEPKYKNIFDRFPLPLDPTSSGGKRKSKRKTKRKSKRNTKRKSIRRKKKYQYK